MKNVFKVFIICVLVGVLSAFLIIKEYKVETKKNSNTSLNEVIYLLQVGAYEKSSNVVKATRNLPLYYVEEEADIYHIYVGVVKNKENIDKIKEFYKVFGNNIYIKEKTVSNKSFLELLDKYETVIMNTSESSVVYSIQKEILSKYKEL